MRRRLLAAMPLMAFLGFAGAVANNLYRESAEGYSPSEIPSALIDRQHPSIALPALPNVGVPGLSDKDLKGQVTVVNVFASWCIPCLQEHPFLMQLAKDPRFKIVAINYKDDPVNAAAFLQRNGNPYVAIGSDRSGREAINWGVYGVPETFVIDKMGRIVFKQVGPLDSSTFTDKVLPFLEQLIAGGKL